MAQDDALSGFNDDLMRDLVARQIDRKSLRWGSWFYDPSDFALTFRRDEDGATIYSVPLQMTASAPGAMHHILHLRSKSWCDPQHLNDFISALEGLLGRAVILAADECDPRGAVVKNNFPVPEE